MQASESQKKELTKAMAEKAELETLVKTLQDDLAAARMVNESVAEEAEEARAELEKLKSGGSEREEQLAKELEAANTEKENFATQIAEVWPSL